MAAHQVHLRLRRAPRRPRAFGSLAARAAVGAGLSALAAAGATWAAMQWFGEELPVAVGSGVGAAALAAAAAGTVGARLGAALRGFAYAARQAARGDLGAPVPEGPGSEVSLLGAAFQQMLAGAAADRRRRAEQAGALGARIGELTRELERSRREREAFLQVVTRDLRAPVLGIRGLANLMVRDLGGRLEEEGRERLGAIRARAEAMEGVLRELLEISLAGETEDPSDPVDAGEAVAKALREFESERGPNALRPEAAAEVEPDG